MVQVATVCSHIPTQPYYHYQDGFLASLARFGVNPVVLGFGDEWRGLIGKPKRFRHWLRHEAESDYVMLTDCFDVVFQKHPDSILDDYLRIWKSQPVVFNAERGLFPRSDLAEHFPETGTPFRYLNSGFIIGKRFDVLDMIESYDWDALGEDRRIEVPETIHYNGHIPFTGSTEKVYQHGEYYTPNDQGEYQEIWSRKPVPMELDAHAELCITGHGSELSDFRLEDGLVRNLITDTVPGVFHFNGGAKNELLPELFKHWGL